MGAGPTALKSGRIFSYEDRLPISFSFTDSNFLKNT